MNEVKESPAEQPTEKKAIQLAPGFVHEATTWVDLMKAVGDTEAKRLDQVLLKDFKMSDTGTVTFDDTEYRFTAEAFVKFCELLGIPSKFVYGSDVETLMSAVKRKMVLYQNEYRVVYTTPQKSITNVTPTGLPVPFTNMDIATELSVLMDDRWDVILKKAILDEQRLSLILVVSPRETLFTGEARIEQAIHIVTSENGWAVPTASNGMVVNTIDGHSEGTLQLPRFWGEVKRPTKKELSLEDQRITWVNSIIPVLDMGFAEAKAVLNHAKQEPMTDAAYAKLWSKTKSLLDETRADKLLGVTTPDRYVAVKTVQARRSAESRKPSIRYLDEPFPQINWGIAIKKYFSITTEHRTINTKLAKLAGETLMNYCKATAKVIQGGEERF